MPGAVLVGLALAGAATAQSTTPRMHVSTTSDLALAGLPPTEDTVLFEVGGGDASHPFFAEGHWQATTGFVPTDVDGFARRFRSPRGTAASMAFSLQSNEQGFLDGDVLGCAPGGGLEVVVSEAQLLAGLGVPNENIDVDALAFEDNGRLLFSLQTDLAGTLLGTVEDGDVLVLEPNGSVSMVMTEVEAQAKFSAATGLGDAIGDVLAIDWTQGELWMTVQSPSTHDGAVISCATIPYVVAEETALGLGGAEIDALSAARSGDDIASFTLFPTAASPGATLTVLMHARPNSRHLVLMSGGTGFIDFSHRPGFGAWYFDPVDPWLKAVIQGPGTPHVTVGPTGTHQTTWKLPLLPVFGAGFAGEDGWSVQTLDTSTFELSAPYRVTKL